VRARPVRPARPDPPARPPRPPRPARPAHPGLDRPPPGGPQLPRPGPAQARAARRALAAPHPAVARRDRRGDHRLDRRHPPRPPARPLPSPPRRTRALPFPAGALERQLEEPPDPPSGLSRTERQVLAAIARGEATAGALVDAVHAIDPRYPITDLVLLWTLH